MQSTLSSRKPQDANAVPTKNKHAVALGRKGGKRTMALRSKSERVALARKAAKVSAERRKARVA